MRRVLHLTVLLAIATLEPYSVGAQQRPQTNRNPRASAQTTPVPSANHTNGNATRTNVVEIGADAPAPPTVILALGESTIFRCPEEPLQLVFGDPSGFQVVEATEQSKRTEFYLIPTRANVSTNLWIELKSGPVSARLKTVAVKGGAQPSDYNGEVIVREAGYKESLSHAIAKVKTLEQRIAEVESSTKREVADAQRRATIILDEAKTKGQMTAFALLTTEARATQVKRKPRQYSRVQSDSLTAVQLTPLHLDPFGRAWVAVQITNTGKKERSAPSLIIDRIDSNGERTLQLSQSLPVTLPVGQPLIVALMFDVKQQSGARQSVGLPSSVTITIAGGKALTFPLEP